MKTVIFKNPQGDEINEKFKVVEDRGDRLLVELICDMPIPPTFVYLKSEMIYESDVKLLNFKEKINNMSPDIEKEIYDILEIMNYKESSNFSFSLDFWRKFVNYVNNFDK